ncbi:MAG TPA: tetratricopeptide repeat protein [Candidatus Eisenbacteria bacterium]
MSLLIAAAASSAPRSGPLQAPDGQFPSEEALRRYAQGRLLEELGQPRDALSEYYRALLLDTRSLATARRLSEVEARVGDANQSLEFAERALAIDAGDARSLWLKGTALFNLSRGPEALKVLEAAVAADSGRTEYLVALARVGEELDRYDVVARAYRRVVDLDDEDGEAWFQLAAAEARMGHFEVAKHALGEAVAANPERPGALFLEGWIEEGLGDDRRAIDLYREHLKINQRDLTTRRRLIRLLADAKRYPEAYRESQVVSKARPADADALAAEADLAFKAGHAAEAGKTLERLASLAPDDPENVRERVEVLARNKRIRDAVALADSWESRHGGDYRGPMLAARAHFLAEERDKAVEEARRAVALAPDSLAPQIMLGRLHQLAKHWDEASEVWSGIHRAHPALLPVTLDLAYCREQAGDLVGAEKVAREALDSQPQNASALNFLGYLLADHNVKLEEARGLIQKAVDQEPDNGAFVDSMGWVYYRLGLLADARQQLERAVQLTGGDAVVCEHLGDVYKDMRLIELARQQYRRSLAGDGSNVRVRSKLDELR